MFKSVEGFGEFVDSEPVYDTSVGVLDIDGKVKDIVAAQNENVALATRSTTLAEQVEANNERGAFVNVRF